MNPRLIRSLSSPNVVRCLVQTDPKSAEPANGIQPGESIWQRNCVIKAEYPDVLLLYRQGDFYQALGADAEIMSREFNLPLAHQDFGRERVPMCAIPYDESERYVTPLLAKGRKVAIIRSPLMQVPECMEIDKYGCRKMDITGDEKP